MSNVEEDIKRCEQLVKPEHANWIGISNQLAIAHLIDRIKELEAKLEFKKWGDLDNTQFEEYMSQFIPKQKVKDKIKELKNEGNYRTNENPRGRIHFAKEPCDYKIEALEELLKEN